MSDPSSRDRRLSLSIGLLVVILQACANESARVFVPAASYAESLRAWTEQGDSAVVPVGQPLVLHAQRFSGPWLEVRRASLDEGACWWRTPPPNLEEEVAGDLRWTVDPPGAAEFNTDLRLDQSREVRFREPGRYALTPESSGWCSEPYTGNVLHVLVVP